MRRHLWPGLLLALILILGSWGFAQAQEKSLYWQRWDVDIDVQQNSDMLVEEVQEIVFTSGTFRFGFRSIPLDRVERITDIQVSEVIDGVERPYTSGSTGEYGFTTSINSGELEITWYFPPTGDSNHTYIIRYRVIGGLRLYDERVPSCRSSWTWTQSAQMPFTSGLQPRATPTLPPSRSAAPGGRQICGPRCASRPRR